MDPSAGICLMYDHFSGHNDFVDYGTNPYMSEQSNFDSDIDIQYGDGIPLHVDQIAYNNLQTAKNAFSRFDPKQYEIARNNANPFEKIGKSIFITRAAVKLANIDAVHKITPDVFTLDKQRSNKPFTFCDVAAGPGSFTQYLQYRFPNSIGYGITLSNVKGLDWNKSVIDMNKFTPFYGDDNTGNLYTHWKNFSNYVLEKQPSGVDLVVADGGFETDIHSEQEFLSSRLILCESIIGINCTKIGGDFVLKVFDTVTDISAQTLYILSMCFDFITLFKPVSSRPANAEKYLLCKTKRPNTALFSQLLENVLNAYTDTRMINSFLNYLPDNFTDWLTEENTNGVKEQSLAVKDILMQLTGKAKNTEHPYNYLKFLTIWALPS